MKASEPKQTLQAIVAQYEKSTQSLSNRILRKMTKDGELLITKCLLNQNSYLNMVKYHALLFISRNNDRVFLGYRYIDWATVQETDPCFQSFLENSLIKSSKLFESGTIGEIFYDKPELTIIFKTQSKKLRVDFQHPTVGQQWQQQLNSIIHIHKNHDLPRSTLPSTHNPPLSPLPSVFPIYSLPTVAMNWTNFFTNPVKSGQYTTQNHQTPEAMELINNHELGQPSQIEHTLNTVMRMSAMPNQLTSWIISKIKTAQIAKQVQINALQQTKTVLGQNCAKLQAQLKDLKTQFKASQKRYSQQRNQCDALSLTKSDLQRQNQQLRSQMDTHHANARESFQSQQSVAERIAKKEQEVEGLKQKLAEMAAQNQSLQLRLTENRSLGYQLQADRKMLEQKLRNAEDKLRNAEDNLQSAEELQRQLKHKLEAAQSTISGLQSALAQKDRQIDSLNEQNSKLSQRIRSQVGEAEEGLKEKESELERLSLKLESQIAQNYLHIFQGSVLHDYLEEKQFLRTQIQTYSKRPILYTHLLYRYDTINKANFHKYIDNHPHICLVIRLQNGMLLAGYSEDPLSPDKPAAKGGLLCSLTSKASFGLWKGYRSVTYDDYFLIFGNSELRIRWGELVLFSNFAVSNGYYDCRGEKYTALMGSGAQRTEAIEGYEVFQVMFS